MQRYLGECGDGGPVRFTHFLSLDDVMSDSRAAVVLRRLPAKSTGVLGDVRHGQAAALARHRCTASHTRS